MTDYSKLLNPQQCEAATAGDGPILVLAAAGTGKTRTLVHRVSYLAEKGVDPSRIMLLTFTNRAAREMTERAAATAGAAVAPVWSGTFHSICARLLRRNAAAAGYTPSFRILDEEDQKKLVAEGIKALPGGGKDFAKKEVVLKAISSAANTGKTVAQTASAMMSKVAGVDPEAFESVAAFYAKRKRELGAMDFDDLLVNMLGLLENNEGVRKHLQERFEHILVDEYQDTNTIQARLTDILAAGHRNIMAVGDDFQCIYTWRGAQIENILDFPERWSGCRIVKLERNYRSLQGVLDVANAVMKDAGGRFGKTLVPARRGGGLLPRLYSGGDGRDQAAAAVSLVRELQTFGLSFRDIAVLYRSHFQSMDIQMAFARHNIPFRLTSGVGVFEQIHVKDALAFLRILVDPQDELSFVRIATLLPGVGEAGAKKHWAKLGGAFRADDAAARDSLGAMLAAKAKPLWPALAACLAQGAKSIAEDQAGAAIQAFADGFYAEHLRREWEEADADSRLDDLKELAAQIASAPGGLQEFLEEVALFTNLDARRNDNDSDKVTMSTVHQAKGMEWPAVVVPWCTNGMFPSGKAVEESRLDEERRLFYVATTRAKDFLALMAPDSRKMPDGGSFPVDPSPFLRDIPDGLLDKRRIYPSAPSMASSYNRSGAYGGGYGRSGSYGGGYGGGYGGRGQYGRGGGNGGGWKTTWRR